MARRMVVALYSVSGIVAPSVEGLDLEGCGARVSFRSDARLGRVVDNGCGDNC